MKILTNEMNHTRAILIQKALEQEGIPVMVTNQTMAQMIPVVDSSYILKVNEDDLEAALLVLDKVKHQLSTIMEEEFYDADKNDIEYQKRIIEEEQLMTNADASVVKIILALIVFAFIILFIYLSTTERI